MATILLPLAINVVIQVVVTVAIAYFVLFRLLGRDYDAAVTSGGFLGFGLSSMPVAMATMDEVGPALRPVAKGVPSGHPGGVLLRRSRQCLRGEGLSCPANVRHHQGGDGRLA